MAEDKNKKGAELVVCVFDSINDMGVVNYNPTSQTVNRVDLTQGMTILDANVCDVSDSEVTIEWRGHTLGVKLDGGWEKYSYLLDNPYLSEEEGIKVCYRSILPDLDINVQIELIRNMAQDDPETAKLRNQVLEKLNETKDFADSGMWIARAVLNSTDDWSSFAMINRRTFNMYMRTNPIKLPLTDTGWKWLKNACLFGNAFDSEDYDHTVSPGISAAVITGTLAGVNDAKEIYKYMKRRVSAGLEEVMTGFTDPLPTVAKHIVREVDKISSGNAYKVCDGADKAQLDLDKTIEKDLLDMIDEEMSKDRALDDRVKSALFYLKMRLLENRPISDNKNLIKLTCYKALLKRVKTESTGPEYDYLRDVVSAFCTLHGYYADLKLLR